VPLHAAFQEWYFKDDANIAVAQAYCVKLAGVTLDVGIYSFFKMECAWS
jgi:hypothetical protein